MDSGLRKLAVALTSLLALQLVWSGARLALVSEPEPIMPAETSLQGKSVAFAVLGEAQAAVIRSRPLFWKGRQPYVEDEAGGAAVVETRPTDKSSIRGVKLLGVYAAGPNSGIIVLINGERRRLGIDDSIGDWTFTMMSSDGAIFESGGDSKVLQLEHAVPTGKKSGGGNKRAAAAKARRTSAK